MTELDKRANELFGPTYPNLREFAEQVARMNRLGDFIEEAPGEFYRYAPDGCSEPDAQALYALIDRARDLTGIRPADRRCEQCDSPRLTTQNSGDGFAPAGTLSCDDCGHEQASR